MGKLMKMSGTATIKNILKIKGTMETGIEASVAKMEMPSSFELLYSEDIWICDTGASSHSSKSNCEAMNIKSNDSQSLRHFGKAV